MSGGYNPKVANPYMSNDIPQMRSLEFQPPFYFGGSQVPYDLNLPKNSYSGSGLSKLNTDIHYIPSIKKYTRQPLLPNQLRKR